MTLSHPPSGPRGRECGEGWIAAFPPGPSRPSGLRLPGELGVRGQAEGCGALAMAVHGPGPGLEAVAEPLPKTHLRDLMAAAVSMGRSPWDPAPI